MTTNAPDPISEPPAGRLAIQTTGQDTTSALATIVSRAFKRALAFDTVLPSALYDRETHAGKKMRMVVANLAGAIPSARCLDIGSGDGAIASAALSGGADVVRVDTWTRAGTPALFRETLAREALPGHDVVVKDRLVKTMVVEDVAVETIVYEGLGAFNMLILESCQDDHAGPAAADVEARGKRVEAALSRPLKVLEKDFLLIVGDWSLPGVRASLETTIRARRLSCLYAIDIRIGGATDGGVTDRGATNHGAMDQSTTRENDWGRGYFIAVLRKRPSLIGSLLAARGRR